MVSWGGWFVEKLLLHGQMWGKPDFGGAAIVLDCAFCWLGSSLEDDDGLSGDPGSDPSLDAVLESVQLSVATPLERRAGDILKMLNYFVYL